MAGMASVSEYFAKQTGDVSVIAEALRDLIGEHWPQLTLKLAWGFPCWSGNERICSIIAHADRCNLQLWSGARLAGDYLGRIEGTGKALRHVKVYSIEQIDDELIDIMERAVTLDQTDPQRVR